MSKKFVAVLNKSADVQRLLNALGHITAGLAGNTGQSQEMGFISYFDAEGNEYPNISENPFIILKGNGSKIKQFRQDLISNKIPYSCFLDTMTSGGSDVQVAATKEKRAEGLEILALVTFGDRGVLDPLTKKFSVWTMKSED
jgi:hypothetical protein